MDNDTDIEKMLLSLDLDLIASKASNIDDVAEWAAGVEQRARRYEHLVHRLRETGQLTKALNEIQKHFGMFTK